MKRIALALVVTAAGCSSPTAPTSTNPPVVPVSALPTTPPVVPTTPAPTTPTAPSVVTPPSLLSDPRFSLSFYLEMAHDAMELSGGRMPLRRWTRPPKVYVQTVDDRNAPVATSLLDQTAAAIINTTSLLTGGAFGVASLERGPGTREGVEQWLTIKWSSSGICGIASTVGTEGMSITMNHRRPECTCGPLVAKHELGHAMGYYHTSSANDLMVATFQGVCDKEPSAREQFHARVAYSQPIGSLEPR